MKHNFSFLIISALFATQILKAQCVPDAAYSGASAGIYPGITINLPAVSVPEAYSASLTVNTETDTAISVNIGFPINAVAYISAMRINAVNGLPAGFSWAPNQVEWNNGGAAPSFMPVQGCISITGDASAVQTLLQNNPSGASFPLELILDARIHSTSNALLNSALSNTWLSDLAATVPGTGAQTITGYVLTVEPNITGIHEAETSVSLYPNPTEAYISIKGPYSESTSFILSDLSGRTCLTGSLNGSSTPVSLEALPPGIYLLQFDERPDWNQKIIKR
ncbi:MAG: T9SS type A sorting domain-containing protein [Bacteroidia bacterium]